MSIDKDRYYGSALAFGSGGDNGLTKRDWLYGMALSGLLASGRNCGTETIKEETTRAVDAVLEEMHRTNQTAAEREKQ